MQFIEVMADNRPTSTLHRTMHGVGIALIVLPLIYLLSVGPAVIIVVKVPSLRGPIHAVYAPMIWLHDHTSLKKHMDTYLAFWERTAHGN